MDVNIHVLLVLFFLIKFNLAENCVGLHVAAFIPARSGSKGIKDKNLSLIKNETLLARTIRIVKECGKFDSIWVSTDGKKIAEEVNKGNVNVFWRDPVTATDNATTLSAVLDFLNRNSDPDVVAVIQCTSPFIKEEFLRSAFEKILKNGVDCVFSATRSHQLRWKEEGDRFLTPLNFNPEKRPRRQDWNGELVENGMFYFVKRELVISKGILQNNKCAVVEIPRKYSLEIDEGYDLVLAKAMLPFIDP